MSAGPFLSFSSPSSLWSQREESKLCAMNGDWWLRNPVEDSECTTVENSDDDASSHAKVKSYVHSDESTELEEDYLFKRRRIH
ncbi:hypothetical protein PUN28_003689 [Cardiocondyla obscurior]|uniref:Uncharacterized protein n=1 Tax=Cardiocondyla obscurior TaxID=286306 RepID=A0AAW2GP16_9HYME